MPTGQALLIKTIEMITPAVALGADASIALAVMPFAGKVTKVTYSPVADITGADTNTRKVSILNKKQDGNGTTEVAALQFNSGVNATDFDEKTLTLSATAADLVVAAGDVIAFKTAKVGTGIADPGGLIHVEITRD